MNKKISSAICFTLLCLSVLVPTVSWVLHAMSLSVHNVLCAEGYRWIWQNAGNLLVPSYFTPVLAFVIALGCFQYSGILKTFTKGNKTVDEKLGIAISLIVFMLLFAAFLVPVFRVSSAMRSVTGHLFPSPWFECMPYTLSAIAFLTNYSFCLFARKDSYYRLAGQLLSFGISRYSLWLINISLLNFVVQTARYAFG